MVASKKYFETWRGKLVPEDVPNRLVAKIYEEVQKHVLVPILQSTIARLDGERQKTNEQWQDSVLTIKSRISDLMNSRHESLKSDNTQTLEQGAELRPIVETMVDIYMNCRQFFITPFTLALAITYLEDIACPIKELGTIETQENMLAAMVVPGESTSPNIMEVRKTFKSNVKSSLINMAREQSRGFLVFPGSINVTDEQWTSHMLGLKQAIAKVPKDPAFRQQLENVVSPTQAETNNLQEIYKHLLRNLQCILIDTFRVRAAQDLIMYVNNKTYVENM